MPPVKSLYYSVSRQLQPCNLGSSGKTTTTALSPNTALRRVANPRPKHTLEPASPRAMLRSTSARLTSPGVLCTSLGPDDAIATLLSQVPCSDGWKSSTSRPQGTLTRRRPGSSPLACPLGTRQFPIHLPPSLFPVVATNRITKAFPFALAIPLIGEGEGRLDRKAPRTPASAKHPACLTPAPACAARGRMHLTIHWPIRKAAIKMGRAACSLRHRHPFGNILDLAPRLFSLPTPGRMLCASP
jgi:hypothetical protein